MTGRKNQPPLYIEMDFAEALARFGRTKPPEAEELEKATAEKRRLEKGGGGDRKRKPPPPEATD